MQTVCKRTVTLNITSNGKRGHASKGHPFYGVPSSTGMDDWRGSLLLLIGNAAVERRLGSFGSLLRATIAVRTASTGDVTGY